MKGARGRATLMHADMDAFYAAIEQRDDPALRGKPVVVGGSSARGVVTAASYEAREFGIHSAMASAHAVRLCPHAIFLRGDMAKYQRESKRVFEIFRRYTPVVEGISMDEAFLDLEGTERLLGSPVEVGHALRQTMRAELGLAVSVGIAPVKMVAKIASDLAKPDGLLAVEPDDVREFLDPLPVGRIWGVGPVARARLEARGLHTIGDLARAQAPELRQALGSFGLNVAALARGEDLREVEAYRDARSYSEESTFSEDVASRERLHAAIRSHAEAVARRVRRDGVRGRTVTLKLKLAIPLGQGRYPLRTRSRTLKRATDDGHTMARVARELLDRAELECPVRLLGVGLAGFEPAEQPQLALLPEEEETRRNNLNRALDRIRDRFGAGALGPATGQVERAGLSMQIKRGEDEPDDDE